MTHEQYENKSRMNRIWRMNGRNKEGKKEGKKERRKDWMKTWNYIMTWVKKWQVWIEWKKRGASAEMNETNEIIEKKWMFNGSSEGKEWN